MELSVELQREIIDFLISIPNMDTERGQQAFIISAGLDLELKCQIQLGESPDKFIPHLLSKIIAYGTLRDGTYALEAILRTTKTLIGIDKQEYCDRLLDKFHKYAQNSEQYNQSHDQKDSSRIIKPHAIPIIGITFLIGIVSIVYFFHVKERLTPFDPDSFGILVATFDEKTQDRKGMGISIQKTIESTLNARFRELGSQNIIIKKIPTSQISYLQTHKEARGLGEKYQADLVIWGDITILGIIPNLTIVHPITAGWENTAKSPSKVTSDCFSLKNPHFIEPDITLLKNQLCYASLDIQDIKFPALTDEPFLIGSLVIGLNYYQVHEYEKALHYFMQSLSKEPSIYTASIMVAIAGVYASMLDYDKAIETYKKALEINPALAEIIYNNLGCLYKATGNYEQAIVNFTQLLQINPTHSNIYYNRGGIYFDQKDYTSAISDYTKTLELNPNDAEAYYWRGRVYELKNQLEQTINDYTKSLEINPKDEKILYERGRIYHQIGNYEQAIADYSQALTINSENACIYNSRGITYKTIGNYEQAIVDYTQAIRIKPEMAIAYYNRGIVYEIKTTYEQAIIDYSEAIRVDQQYVSAYINRGNVYSKKQDYERAIADYTKAIEIDPEEESAFLGNGLNPLMDDRHIPKCLNISRFHERLMLRQRI